MYLGCDGGTQDHILYDILVYKEWPKTPYIPLADGATKNDTSTNTSSSWLGWITDYWKSNPAGNGDVAIESFPEKILSLFNQMQDWKFAITDDGTFLALVQLNVLEILSAKDHFGTALSRIRLQRDPRPSLRQVLWSPNSSLLVLTSSNGNVDIYDNNCFHVYSVFSKNLPRNQTLSGSGNRAFAGVFFTDIRVKSREFSTELMLVNYRGQVDSFLLSPSGYQEFSNFYLSSNFAVIGCGISSALFSSRHNVLVVAGEYSSGLGGAEGDPLKYGLTMWRLTNESPHYTRVMTHDQDDKRSNFILTKFFFFLRKGGKQENVYAMEDSPDGNFLCTLHASGDIAIWQMPSLKLWRKIPLECQPGFDDVNPNLLQNPRLKKKKNTFLRDPLRWMPTAIRWWNEEAVVIGRYSGGVSIISVKDGEACRNILGESSEFFAGIPAFSKCFGNGFFVLECESSTRRQREESMTEEGDDEAEVGRESPSSPSSSESEDETAFYALGKRAITSLAYMVTESERFSPPRKRPKLVRNTYKLLSLNKTTPEDLYARKIDMEEYGEALIMAQHYGLDSDHVYEKQWKRSNLTHSAITDYLTKIKRRSLVLKECLQTIPNDVDAMRELLNYGLLETGLDVVQVMATSPDRAKTIFSHETGVDYNSSYYMSEDDLQAKAEERENSLMDQIAWQSLTLNQKDLLKTRQTLLKYLNRLESYLDIVEDSVDFDRSFYLRFRNQPILDSVIEFARAGQSWAVATVFKRHGEQLSNHYLVVLSNFPESISPQEYGDLIPTVDKFDRVSVPFRSAVDKDRFVSSKSDWLEYEFVQTYLTSQLVRDGESDSEECDQGVATNMEFYVDDVAPSSEVLARWVDKRARDIERESSLVDHALSLLSIASAKGIKINPRLYFNLSTLDVMMYETQTPQPLSLSRLEQMSDLEVVDKLMKNSDRCNFFNNVHRILIPHLERLVKLESEGARATLLRHYLLHLSSTSLVLPLELIKNSTVATTSRPQVFCSVEESISIGIDCIYACKDAGCESSSIGDCDPLSMMLELTNVLQKRCRNPHFNNELQDIQMMIKGCKIVRKYGIVKSLQCFRASRSQQRALQELFVQITRRAEGKKPKLSGREWFEVLRDLLELRSLFPIVPLHYCMEIICESLLCSEDMENVKLVEEMFDYSPADALFKGKSSMLYTLSVYKIGSIPSDVKIGVVSKACDYYFDSSKDVDDPNLGLARYCLNVLDGQKNPKLKKFYSLLDALDMLADFGLSILPIVLRTASSNCASLKRVVEKILQVDPTAYKNVRKILKLVRYLNDSCVSVEDGTTEFALRNENAVLNIIADFALKAEDYESCHSVCEMLMEECQIGKSGSGSDSQQRFAVKSCLELSKNHAFQDVSARHKLASFCVNFCTDDQLEAVLRHRSSLSDRLPDPGVFLASVPSTSRVLPLPAIPDAAVELSKSVVSVAANVAGQAADRTVNAISNVTPIPSAAVGISKTLATAVAAGTNVATETGSRAISSFFGRFAKFTPVRGSDEAEPELGHHGVADDKDVGGEEEEEPEKNVAAVVAKGSSSPSMRIDAFYENDFPSEEVELGRLSFPFQHFSSVCNSVVDRESLLMLKNHFRNGDEVSWRDLEKLLLQILREDAPLGMALLLVELANRGDETVQVDVSKNKEKIEDQDSIEGWGDANFSDIVGGDDDESFETVEVTAWDSVSKQLQKDEKTEKLALYLLLLSDLSPYLKSRTFQLTPYALARVAKMCFEKLPSHSLVKKVITRKICDTC